VNNAPAVLADRRQPLLWRMARAAVQRLGWGVADQGMSSVTNFAVNIYIARTLGADQYGAFSLAFVTYSFALNASRGLATDPLMVRHSGIDVATWRRATASCTGTATLVGLASAVCVLLAAIGLHGAPRLAFLALGLTMPGLLLQDSWRFAFFALGRGGHAFLNDTVWAIVLFPALIVLKRTDHATLFSFVLAWGLSACVAALVGPLQARVLPKLTDGVAWVVRHRDLGFRYMAEGTASSGSTQLRNYGIGLILGLAALGYVQAVSTLMGPFMVVFFGMGLVTLPEAARQLRRSRRHLTVFCLLISAGLSVLAVIWSVLLLVALPRGLGHYALGSLWRPTYPLILPFTFFIVGTCLSAGAGIGLHAMAASRRSLRAMLIYSGCYVAACLIGAALDGAVGTIYGCAVAGGVSALVFWLEFRAELRSPSPSPSPSPARRGSAPTGRHRALSRSQRRAANLFPSDYEGGM
jgi:O-antigen/teichoic acid export membrane protein